MNEVIESSAGKELINATQEAVIGAVSDVGNIIKTTTEEISNGGHELFYQSAEFWVGVSFVMVLCLLYVPLKKVLMALLQKRIDNVVTQMKEAEQIRDEARNFLADYEQKIENIKSGADVVIKKARKDAEEFKLEELKKFEDELAVQEKYASAMLKLRSDMLFEEIQGMVADRAGEVLRSAIVANLSEKSKKSLIDSSIKNLSGLRSE